MASAERRGGGGTWLPFLTGNGIGGRVSCSELSTGSGDAGDAAFDLDGSGGTAPVGLCGTVGVDFEVFKGPLAVVCKDLMLACDVWQVSSAEIGCRAMSS